MFMAEEDIAYFTIDTELTPDSYGDLIRFIHRHYLMPQMGRFTNVELSLIHI